MMRNHKPLGKRFWLNDNGFTLIELLMVVIILGILAAVVIPQFSSSSQDAKVSALKSNLNSIRGALELYYVQHNSTYPDPNNFTAALLKYTDQSGNISNTKDETHKYGPYLKQGFPKNPIPQNEAKADQVEIDKNISEIGKVSAAEDPNAAGWKYVAKTGEFIANHPDYDQY
ncbi:MAG: type II secretion system GspH family protein [bacterium]|nr:type II secretion system GspH family protein [bacterium]